MRTTIKTASAIICLFALVAFGVRQYARWTNSPHPAKFAVARHGDLKVQILLSGSVEPKTKMVVKSQFPGKVAKVFVQPGDRVQEGQPIALLEGSEVDWQDKRLQTVVRSTFAHLPEAVDQLLQSQSVVLDDLLAMESHLRRVERFLTTPATTLADRTPNETTDTPSSPEDNHGGGLTRSDEPLRGQQQEAVRSLEQVRRLLGRIRTEVSRLSENGGGKARSKGRGRPRSRSRVGGGGASGIVDAPTRHVVTAPMSGTVIARNALPGDLVSGGLSPFGGGQELAVIADTSTMVIKALIPEVDVARVREGQTATVRLDALRQRVFTGRIERIAPAPREQRGALAQFSTGESVWYEVQVHLDDTDPRLRTGMSANVDLTAETIHDVIYLPQEAIFEEMGRWYVWQVMDKQLAGTIRETPATVTDARGNIIEESSVRLEKKLVHIGAYNDLFTQIRTGLPEGTVVLIKPPLRGRRTFEIK